MTIVFWLLLVNTLLWLVAYVRLSNKLVSLCLAMFLPTASAIVTTFLVDTYLPERVIQMSRIWVLHVTIWVVFMFMHWALKYSPKSERHPVYHYEAETDPGKPLDTFFFVFWGGIAVLAMSIIQGILVWAHIGT